MKKLVYLLVLVSQVVFAGDMPLVVCTNKMVFDVSNDVFSALEKLALCSAKIPSTKMKIDVEDTVDLYFDEFIFVLKQFNKGEIKKEVAVEKLGNLWLHIPIIEKSEVDDTFDVIFPKLSEDGNVTREKFSFRVTNE